MSLRLLRTSAAGLVVALSLIGAGAPTPRLNLQLGYRTVNFNYAASGGFDLGFNIHMKGPILAATFRC